MEPLVARPQQYFIATPPARSPEPVKDAVADTELPASKTVEQNQTVGRQEQTEIPRERQEKVKREGSRDPDTNTMVFKTINSETGEVLKQIPEEATLRLRKALAEVVAPETPGVNVDQAL